MDIEGDMQYGGWISGAACTELSLKKKETKAVLRYIKGGRVIRNDSLPVFPQPPPSNRLGQTHRLHESRAVNTRGICESPFHIVSDYFGLRCPFACLSATKIACCVVKYYTVLQMASLYASAAESSASIPTSAMGFHEPSQMQVKSPRSPPCLDNFSSPYPPHAFLGNDSNTHDQELIPPIPRLPCTQSTLDKTTNSAISFSQTKSTYTHSGQDVPELVNSLISSPVPRSFGHLPNPSETPVSSSQLLTNHVLSHPIRRPRAHNQVFQSSKDLAAHYGIPQILPPAPRTTTILQSSTRSPIIDFSTLRSSYLSMLSQNPSDNTNMTDPVAPPPTAVTPEDLSAPVISDDDPFATMFGMEISHRFFECVTQVCIGSLTAPHDVWEMATPSLKDDTSPCSPDIINPYLSTPQDSTWDTPLFEYLDESQMLTGPDYAQPLFPLWSDMQEPVTQPKPAAAGLDVSALISMSPSSPLYDSFDPSQLTQATEAPPSSVKPATTRRKVTSATGIRKGVTPENLLDETAPTQARHYVTPSVTSRKEVPAVFARKRARSTAFGDEEDQLDDYVLPPNPTEKDLIEQKRRQNTVAARRSRKRKLEHLQLLEKSLEEERQQKEQWRQRALMLSSILSGLNQPVPDFSTEDSWTILFFFLFLFDIAFVSYVHHIYRTTSSVSPSSNLSLSVAPCTTFIIIPKPLAISLERPPHLYYFVML